MKESLARLRLRKEIQDICLSQGDTLEVEYKEDGARIFYSFLVREGVYAQQRYKFLLNVPQDYPFSPPKAICISKVFHPSIDAEGRVCMSITREDWSVSQGIQVVLFGLSSIFYDLPEEDPLNKEALEVFLRDKKEYSSRVLETYRSNE